MRTQAAMRLTLTSAPASAAWVLATITIAITTASVLATPVVEERALEAVAAAAALERQLEPIFLPRATSASTTTTRKSSTTSKSATKSTSKPTTKSTSKSTSKSTTKTTSTTTSKSTTKSTTKSTSTTPTSTPTAAPVPPPPPPNVAQGTITKDCTHYYTVQPGNTCNAVSQLNNLTLAALYALNPQLDSSRCTNLQLGQAYCVASSTRTGPASCRKTYAVQGGDTCVRVGEMSGVSLAQLRALNPGVIDEACSNIYVGEVLCVDPSAHVGGAPLTSATASAATTTTSSSSTTTTTTAATSTTATITAS